MGHRTLADFFKELDIKCPKDIDGHEAMVVLDGSKDAIGFLKFQLESIGIKKVRSFTTGLEAFKFLEECKEPISVTICANALPDIKGFEFLAEVQDSPKIRRTPFLLSMEFPTREKLMFALEHGVDDILGKPFSSKELYPKLQKAFQRFHKLGSLEKLYGVANQAIFDGAYQFAEKIFNEIRTFMPEASRPLVGLARIRMSQAMFTEAETFLQQSIAMNPHYVHAYSLLGEAYLGLTEYNQSLEYYKKALELSPLNPIRYECIAQVLREQSRPHETIKIIKEALEHQVETPDLLHMLSQACMETKNFQDGIRYIRMALRGDTDNIHYLNQMGICLRMMEDYQGARETYNQIIKLDPDNVHALYNKAILFVSEGQKEKAIVSLEMILWEIIL